MSANGATNGVELIKPKPERPVKRPAAKLKGKSVETRLAEAEQTIIALTWFTDELMRVVKKMIREKIIEDASPQLIQQAQAAANEQANHLRAEIDAKLAGGFET